MRLRGGHCQVPCGIFDDPAMVEEIKQHVATIRKACIQIGELSAANGGALELNQMVRWINTKEDHCCKIITAVGEYCLCQRVKKEVFASDADYVEALKSHHSVMQCAMKCKQNVDASFVDALEKSIGIFGKMYTKE